MPFRIHLLQLVALLLQAVASVLPHYGYSQNEIAPPIIAYNFNLTTENGLTQNNIACIIKDNDGFMWMGTGDGLNRFDGYSFVHFIHSDADPSSISNNAIKRMLIDSKGRLWVGTYRGLNLYDSKSETFRQFLVDPRNEGAANTNTVLDLLEDNQGKIWVGTYGEIYKIDVETLKVEEHDHKKDNTGLDAISVLFKDRNGKIWAGTPKGISVIGPSGIERSIPYSEAEGGLPADIIVSIAQDATGAMYFGTNGHGVIRLDDESDETFEPLTTNKATPFLGTDIIGSLAVDKDGKLLVGTDGAGIYRQDEPGKFRQLLGSQSTRLQNGNIVNIFVDNENTYWLSLVGGGVQVVYASSKRFEHYRYFDSEMERTGKNSVLAITEDLQHKIWIGTDGAGLFRFDPDKKTFTSYRNAPNNKKSLSSNVVKSLMADAQNNIYAGTFGGGLNYLDTKTGTVTRFMHEPGRNTSISTNHVWSLLQGEGNKIYAGQLTALDEFNPESEVFKPLPFISPKYTPSIHCMNEDRAGNIWIGTRQDGLHRYDPRTRTFKSFLNSPGDAASMPTNEIVEMATNAEGKLLIGTGNKGMVLLDPETFTLKRIVPGFDEQNITNIVEDELHNIWFTASDGVHKFDPSVSKTYNYTITDGLQGTQFNDGASLMSTDGLIYLGGTNGLNIFRPDNLAADTTNAEVVFTQLTLFSTPVKVNDNSRLLTTSISQTEVITLQPDQNVFSIEFACLEFSFPKKNKYRYFLDGFDKGWNDANTSRTATYTALPPGEYTLKISASNSSGYWNESAASIRIVVIPRWHERIETRLGAVALLIILTVFIVHFRTELLFRQKVKLEQIVKARTELVENQKIEINDKNKKLELAYEEVNSTNEELQRVNLNLEKLVEERTSELTLTIKKLVETDKGLETFLYRSSHDLRGPISTILGLARLGKTYQSPEDLTLYLAKIEKTSTHMLRLLKRLAETSALFRAEHSLEKINTDQLIASVRTSLNEWNTDNVVKIEFENKIGETFTGDQALLTCIIVNLLENSIVFRSDDHPYARCVLAIEHGQLIINVIDNGMGIHSSAIDRISDMFYRGSEKSIGNGLGLFMVKKALEILNGTMEIDSKPGIITTVAIKIPYLNL